MIDLMTLVPGIRIRLVGERIAEVVENMDDGQWVMGRIVAAPDAGDIGSEELCHALDILGLDDGEAST